MTDLERAREIVTQFHLRSDFIRISLADARELTSNIAAALAAVREEAAQVIPTSWLDPALTGPDRIIGKPPYSCQDIERLFQHFAAAIRKGGEW